MAGGKETPRQKMIGMMYLVLTALLALNVSKDILDAFVVVNDSLQRTERNFKDKIDSDYSSFEAAFNENPAKVGPNYEKAKEIRTETNALIKHITNLKAELIAYTEGLPLEMVTNGDTVLSLNLVAGKDNYDKPTEKMIGPEPATPKDGEFTAVELKSKINAYREKLYSFVKEKDKGAVNLGLETDDPVGESWETSNFYHIPIAAVVTILSKIQTDVKNAESDLIKYLLADVDAASIKFTGIEAAVIAPSSYIVQGDSFRAKVFLAAFDTTQKPSIYYGKPESLDSVNMKMVGEYDSLPVRFSKGIVAIPATTEGVYEWAGIIELKSNGNIIRKPYKFAYQVAKPSLVVSPDKMNVFYKGVDNPVSVSVPGVPAEDLTVTISNGSITKVGKGKYNVKVSKGSTANISVTAKIQGANKSMGTSEFRVKSVPDPVAYFGTKSKADDKITLSELKVQAGVAARLENFDFDLKFQISAFTLTTIVGGTPLEEKATSAYLTPNMKAIIKKLNRGQKVYFENIKAKGPDGTVRSLGSLSFKII